MELSRKTTILLSDQLYERLTGLARRRGVSLGHLVREACERQYGFGASQERLSAVRELASLELPVGDVAEMKGESVPDPDDLLP
jgi:predicted DNA-binding ribbon-helix-helix protein